MICQLNIFELSQITNLELAFRFELDKALDMAQELADQHKLKWELYDDENNYIIFSGKLAIELIYL